MNETVVKELSSVEAGVVKAIHESNMDWFKAGLNNGFKYAIVGALAGGAIICISKMTENKKSKETN